VTAYETGGRVEEREEEQKEKKVYDKVIKLESYANHKRQQQEQYIY